ncbi:MAG TPA: energy-coupling factor transporter transmembrane protein EcfT [Propionibacteriaceae bacterium]|nr:energy-coupling factor transporter transmembrane protein EcfT [Propionibacteriaceae bacterium]
MKSSAELFGTYRPAGSPLERVSVGWKYVLLLVLSVPAIAVGTWWFSLVSIVVTVAVLVGARVGVRRATALSLGLVVVGALIVVVQALAGRVMTGVVVVENLVLALYATRVLTLTTPIPELVDGIAVACRPLRLLRVDPDRVALAVAVMVRSLPHLLGAFDEVRDAATARGIRRNPTAYVAPVVVRAVAYAHATGDALAARGLGEDDRRLSDANTTMTP